MTIKDWLASRSMRLHLFFTAAYSAAMPVLIGFTEADWETVGLSQRAALIIVAVLNILHGIGGTYMRLITTSPLKGRADNSPDPMNNVQDGM